VQQILRACGLAPAEARALLALALQAPRERLIAHPEARVDAPAAERFARLVAERRAGRPMAYLLGEQEFYGHVLGVTPAVLIPRPDTELLVETALDLLRGHRAARVLELGTGSGCIALALALERPDLHVVASDRSVPALQVARENGRRLGVALSLVAGDWYAPIQGRFDLIISNPPYIAADDAHLAELGFEPRTALTDGGDGLAALRAVVAGARARLAPGGHLLVEHGYDQGPAMRERMRAHGFDPVTTLRDLAGRERACLGATALAGKDGMAGS
jgi:release factor glutamine methyltransferase